LERCRSSGRVRSHHRCDTAAPLCEIDSDKSDDVLLQETTSSGERREGIEERRKEEEGRRKEGRE
jgi:hypothetical protein